MNIKLLLILALSLLLVTSVFSQNAKIYVGTDDDNDDRYYGLSVKVYEFTSVDLSGGFEFGTLKAEGLFFFTPNLTLDFALDSVLSGKLHPKLSLLNVINTNSGEDNFGIGLGAFYEALSFLDVGFRYNEDSDTFLFLLSADLK